LGVIVTDCLLPVIATRKCCKPGTSASDHSQDGPTDTPKEQGMDDEIRIQDLAADEIRDLLLEEGSELDEQQAAAVKKFLQDIGGMENALAAIAMLNRLEEAA